MARLQIQPDTIAPIIETRARLAGHPRRRRTRMRSSCVDLGSHHVGTHRFETLYAVVFAQLHHRAIQPLRSEQLSSGRWRRRLPLLRVSPTEPQCPLPRVTWPGSLPHGVDVVFASGRRRPASERSLDTMTVGATQNAWVSSQAVLKPAPSQDAQVRSARMPQSGRPGSD